TQLLDAADRVMRRRGAGASMDEIASEAGISKPILYRHFGDKDGLHRALAERYVEALLSELRASRVADDPRANIAAGIDAYRAFPREQLVEYLTTLLWEGFSTLLRPAERRTAAG